MMSRLSTGHLARFSSRRPRTVVAAWVVALVLAAVASGTLLSDAMTNDIELTNNPESARANGLIEERLGTQDDSSAEIVVFHSDSLTVDDPSYRAAVESALAAVEALDQDESSVIGHYYSGSDESLVSEDRGTTIAFVDVADEDAIHGVREAIHAATDGSAVEALLTGVLSVNAEFNEIAEEDLQKGESIGLLAAMIILALVFGAVAAAFIPIVLSVAAIVVAIGVTAVIGQTFEMTFFVVNIITMMGLAVGIDYSLFVVSRYREERRKGHEKLDAIERAGDTASRAVLFSGMTVVLALIGMVIMPDTIFTSLGLGAITVVVASVLSSLTLLPAVLSLVGDRVNSIRVPFVGRNIGSTEDSDGGFWDRTTRAVMGKPVLSLVLGAGLLIAAATPVLDMKTGVSGVESAPASAESREGFVIVQEEFGFGQDAPAVIVIDGQTESAAITDGLARLDRALALDPEFGALEIEVHQEANLTIARTRIAGDPVASNAIGLIDRLRDDYVPSAFGSDSHRVLVTGETAFVNDWVGNVEDYTPIVFAIVLGLSFVVLMLAFRSVVVPVTAIIMNLISVGAAYGLIVLVFQKGVGADLLGFQKVEAIEVFLPLYLFSILFGLSMDYHVFLLSRIRERFDHSGDNSEAVASGLRSTGRLITGAALIMVAVFGGFALGDLGVMQQMGFGLAVAVFLDATIVRSVLVPSTMKLLGKWNWYLPGWMSWLPDLRVEGGAEKPPAKPIMRPALAPFDGD